MAGLKGLIAYPGRHTAIGTTIRSALNSLHAESRATGLVTWEENEVVGTFLDTPIFGRIEEGNILVADITYLNFNVLFEIGYAIGASTKTFLIKNTALRGDDETIRKIGLLDTIGFSTYATSEELAQSLARETNPTALPLPATEPSKTSPVYLLLPRVKTDVELRTMSRLKAARINFRLYDPEEQGRMAAREAIEQVVRSHGIVAGLLPERRVGWDDHNYRVAFAAGLALAQKKALCLLQEGEDPVPLDYRDLVNVHQFPDQIDEHIGVFSTEIAGRLQASIPQPPHRSSSFLERLSLGASAAENEVSDLDYYYLETDEFRRALRGEVSVVAGRKGSGKTALFMYLRDRLSPDKSRLVLDLKPEGFQLLKFRERVLDYLEEGSQEHTITAFWEYLLLLEMCRELLENDREIHLRDNRLFDVYQDLETIYYGSEFIGEGDFAERMLSLGQSIADDFEAAGYNTPEQALSTGAVTELIYRHDMRGLREALLNYLAYRPEVWILFDNLDKGWPARGVGAADVLTLRALIEAVRKIERHLERVGVTCHGITFIRNDVLELLVEQTPDRGKLSRVLLDWTDADLLREMLRRRLLMGEQRSELSFDDIWRQVCVSHIRGQESSQYLIDRCLMRPRALIELVQHCRSHAVNLRHERIEVDDLVRGEEAYSAALLTDVSYEIQDVLPEAEDVLYQFLEASSRMSTEDVRSLISGKVGDLLTDKVLDVLLWYGFLGVVRQGGSSNYIYDVRYDMKRLRVSIEQDGPEHQNLEINPAFWASLEVRQPSR